MICPKCNGVGIIPFGEAPEIFSEEEWLRQATTEELAECITNISFNTGYNSYDVVRRKIMIWLKQPHHKE